MRSLPHQRLSNPDVGVQRAGFCVVDRKTDLFLCDDTKSPHGMVMGRGYSYGYCRASGPVRVWLSLAVALEVATKVSGKVTTVPRAIGGTAKGPVLTWESVA